MSTADQPKKTVTTGALIKPSSPSSRRSTTTPLSWPATIPGRDRWTACEVRSFIKERPFRIGTDKGNAMSSKKTVKKKTPKKAAPIPKNSLKGATKAITAAHVQIIDAFKDRIVAFVNGAEERVTHEQIVDAVYTHEPLVCAVLGGEVRTEEIVMALLDELASDEEIFELDGSIGFVLFPEEEKGTRKRRRASAVALQAMRTAAE